MSDVSKVYSGYTITASQIYDPNTNAARTRFHVTDSMGRLIADVMVAPAQAVATITVIKNTIDGFAATEAAIQTQFNTF